MTRRRMLLLIIGSLITVSTAVGVGVNFATANGSSQTSLIKGIDTSSPITKDGEETNVIDKEEDKSPSTPPAKVEINDKRKVSQTQTKDKQEPAKQTTPPTNSPVVIRKEGGTSNTNNKGTQLIIGDASKLNLPQENKEESKDSKPKPAVVIINKGTPTPSPAKEVKKNEEESGSSKQNLTDAPVVTAGQPQPQKTSPQQKKEVEPNSSNISVQTQQPSQDNKLENNVDTSGHTQKNEEEQHLESNDKNQEIQNKIINLKDGSQSTTIEESKLIKEKPKPTQSEIKVEKLINDFKTANYSNLDILAKQHTIKPNEYELFFKSIPKDWVKDPTKLSNLSTFWDFNWLEILKESGMDETVLQYSPGLKEQGRKEFRKYLDLAQTGQLDHNIVTSGGSFKVDGVPPGDHP